MSNFGFKVQINSQRQLGELQGMAERARNLKKPLTDLGEHLVNKTRRVLDSGERGIQARHRSGLSGSLTHRVDGSELTIGTNVVYGRSQQWGPVGGFYESSRPNGFLTIPIADNVDAKGSAKKLIDDVPEGQGFFLTSKKGNLLFYEKLGQTPKGKQRSRSKYKGAALAKESILRIARLLFVLKRRVPGQAHNYATFDPSDQTVWERLASSWVIRGK